MNWTTKGVAALATGITLFCGMGTVTAVALTGHHGTAPAAAAAPARTATPPAAVTPPAPKTTAPAPTPTKTIIVQASSSAACGAARDRAPLCRQRDLRWGPDT